MPPDADTWTTPEHVVEDTVSMRLSLVLIGPGGLPHVVLLANNRPGLFLTRRVGDTWTQPALFAGWNRIGGSLRGTTDGQHRIHVVFCGGGRDDTIWYARYDTSGWTGPEVAAFDASYRLLEPDVTAGRDGEPQVVFTRDRDTLGPGYTRRTVCGWTSPSYARQHITDEWNPKIVLDTLGVSHVVWCDGQRQTIYSCWAGDSWTLPERLDSLEGHYPSVCVDSWNQVHVLFGDAAAGYREKVRRGATWTESYLVDSFDGWSEVEASRNMLHLLRCRANGVPLVGEVLYHRRPLCPPGVDFEHVILLEEPPGGAVLVSPNTVIRFSISCAERVVMDFFDPAGRRIGHCDLGVLPAGIHGLTPYSRTRTAGITFCRVTLGRRTRSVKLVRSD
jgi:hypothetical protein